MGLTLVEADPGATLHVYIQDPIDEKERTFDAANFAESGVIARMIPT